MGLRPVAAGQTLRGSAAAIGRGAVARTFNTAQNFALIHYPAPGAQSAICTVRTLRWLSFSTGRLRSAMAFSMTSAPLLCPTNVLIWSVCFRMEFSASDEPLPCWKTGASAGAARLRSWHGHDQSPAHRCGYQRKEGQCVLKRLLHPVRKNAEPEETSQRLLHDVS